jgi:predicted HTH transcriptional regulator
MIPPGQLQWQDDVLRRSRFTDPPTSSEGPLNQTNVSELQERILSMLERRAMTDEQLCEVLYGASQSGIRTRRNELVKAGKVMTTGDTRKTKSGREALIWQLSK